jgi:excisionase family DNA binding protein
MRVRPRANGKFLTPRQAEAEYGIPYQRIWEWVREGRLPHLDDGRRSYLIRRVDLDRFINETMSVVRS